MKSFVTVPSKIYNVSQLLNSLELSLFYYQSLTIKRDPVSKKNLIIEKK